ncbi:MAG: ImmA/IrrE family metallo-endopeptidase [Acidimicrobiales bacterium]
MIENLGLIILCEEIDEPEGTTILGALDPATGTVRLNERHLELFDSVIGPERFTYAHELGHWLYDAVDGRTQASLFDVPEAPVLCRSAGTGESADIREVNANGFAAALLLPEGLLRAALAGPFESLASFNDAAARWGVSRMTLRIRLEKLGLGSFIP